MMKVITFFIILICNISFCYGQIENDAEFEKEINEVTTFSDFVDRFNFDPNSSFIQYTKKKFPGQELSRKSMLVALLDQNKDFSRELALQYIENVLDTANPYFFDYSDWTKWFVVLEAKLSINNKSQIFTLKLNLRKFEDESFAWVISDIISPLPIQDTNYKKIIFDDMKTGKIEFNEFDSIHFLVTTADAFNFSSLEDVFLDYKYFLNYCNTIPHISDELFYFAYMLKRDKIKYIDTINFKYYLIGPDSLCTKIEQVNSQTNKSGWLITKIFADSQTMWESIKKK